MDNRLKEIIILATSRAINLYNSVGIVKIMGPENIGISTLMQSYTSISAIGYDYALNEIILKSQRKNNANDLYATVLFLRLLLASTISIIIILLAFAIDWIKAPIYIICFVIFAIIKNSIDPLLIYRNTGKMDIYYSVGIISPIMVAIIYSLLNEKYIFAGIDFITINLSLFLVNIILLLKWIKKLDKIKIRLKKVIFLIKNNWGISLGSIINTITFSMQLIIAGLILGVGEIGVMRASLILVLPLELIYQVIQNKTFIDVKNIIDRNDANNLIYDEVKKNSRLFVIPVLLAMIIPENFIQQILGHDYKYSHSFFVIVAVSKFMLIVSAPLTLSMYLIDGRKAILESSLLMFITMFIAIPFVYYFHLIGLALSMFLVDAMLPAYGFYKLRKMKINCA